VSLKKAASGSRYFPLITRAEDLTSNQTFAAWGDVFGGRVIATECRLHVFQTTATLGLSQSASDSLERVRHLLSVLALLGALCGA
jgi:hypothetical protein